MKVDHVRGQGNQSWLGREVVGYYIHSTIRNHAFHTLIKSNHVLLLSLDLIKLNFINIILILCYQRWGRVLICPHCHPQEGWLWINLPRLLNSNQHWINKVISTLKQSEGPTANARMKENSPVLNKVGFYLIPVLSSTFYWGGPQMDIKEDWRQWRICN